MFIWDVLAVTVKLARLVSVVPKFIGVAPESVVVPVSKSMVLDELWSDAIDPAVKLYVARSNDPLVTVNADVPISSALPNAHAQSTPFIKTFDASVTPLVVNVSPVELLDSVIAPVYVRVSPVAGSVTLPCIPTIAVDPASVTFPDAGPAMVRDFMRMPPVTALTVAV